MWPRVPRLSFRLPHPDPRTSSQFQNEADPVCASLAEQTPVASQELAVGSGAGALLLLAEAVELLGFAWFAKGDIELPFVAGLLDGSDDLGR